MAIRSTGKPAKPGRSAKRGGSDSVVSAQVSAEIVAAIDAWAEKNGAASREEAIGRLVKQALARQPRPAADAGAQDKEALGKARELAGAEIDRLGDPSTTPEEREKRKRRLTKGPKEFRDIRGGAGGRKAKPRG